MTLTISSQNSMSLPISNTAQVASHSNYDHWHGFISVMFLDVKWVNGLLVN